MDGVVDPEAERGMTMPSKRDASYLGSREDDVANLIRSWKSGSMVEEIYGPPDRWTFARFSTARGEMSRKKPSRSPIGVSVTYVGNEVFVDVDEREEYV